MKGNNCALQVGNAYTWPPSGFAYEMMSSVPGRKREKDLIYVTGKIIYIHPEGRYFTAEAVLDGGVIRESFLLRGEGGVR